MLIIFSISQVYKTENMDITINKNIFNGEIEPYPSIQRQNDTQEAANHTITQEVVD